MWCLFAIEGVRLYPGPAGAEAKESARQETGLHGLNDMNARSRVCLYSQIQLAVTQHAFDLITRHGAARTPTRFAYYQPCIGNLRSL